MPLRTPLRRPELPLAAITALLMGGPGGLHAEPGGFSSPLPFPHKAPPEALGPPPKAGAESPARVAAATRYEPQAQAQTAPLRVQVIDGSSFSDIESGTVYRLWGIDVCAADQSAVLGRQPWPCGTMARAWLVNATLGKWVSCNVLDKAANALVVRCSSSAYQDIALAMLKDGIAVAPPQDREPKQIKLYLTAQEAARKAFRGLWGSAFDMPWAYRAQRIASDAKADSPSAPMPANPTESPSPSGIAGDEPIQAQNGQPQSPGLVRAEQQQKSR